MLTDSKNKPLPVQTTVLNRWSDGSAKWVLIDFQAEPGANQSAKFYLSGASVVRDAGPSRPVRTIRGEFISVLSGDVSISTVTGSLIRISKRFDVKMTLTGRGGERCEGIVKSAKVETEGKMRTTLCIEGSFVNPEGRRNRISASELLFMPV